MNSVLLTISGVIDPDIEGQIARGERPEADYIAMAREFNADLLDYDDARQRGGWLTRPLEKIGGKNLMMAWACFKLRKQYQVIFTDGEQIGLPFAFFLKFFNIGKRARHLMIVHILSVGKKMILLDYFRLQSHINIFFAYSTWQKKFIEKRWNVPPERVSFTPFMVDSNFFSPEQVTNTLELELPDQPIICSVGLEFRDYPTLIKAVHGLDIQIVIAAGSPWSKREDSTADQDIPGNVLVRRFTQHELRDLYEMSAFMVMPLYDVNFQAGVTALLEAMSMSKAVICSSTPGQTDVVVEGVTGLYVPPENAEALREKIIRFLDQPDETEKMGVNGRKRITTQMNLAHYVTRLNKFVQPHINAV